MHDELSGQERALVERSWLEEGALGAAMAEWCHFTHPVMRSKLAAVGRDPSSAEAEAASFLPYAGAGARERRRKVAALLTIAATAPMKGTHEGLDPARFALLNAAGDSSWWPDAAPLAPADGRLRSPRPDAMHHEYARKVVRLGLGLCLECGADHDRARSMRGRPQFYCEACAKLDLFDRARDRDGMQTVLQLTRVTPSHATSARRSVR